MSFLWIIAIVSLCCLLVGDPERIECNPMLSAWTAVFALIAVSIVSIMYGKTRNQGDPIKVSMLKKGTEFEVVKVLRLLSCTREESPPFENYLIKISQFNDFTWYILTDKNSLKCDKKYCINSKGEIIEKINI